MKPYLLLFTFAAAAVFSPATAQNRPKSGLLHTLESVNATLAAANRTLAGGPPPPRPGIAVITPDQKTAINNQLTQTYADQDVKATVAEAQPVIQAFIERFSCLKDYTGLKTLNIFAAPGKDFSNHSPPMVQVRYHDKGACLTVVRLQGWTKPARNALKFEAVYEAQDSGDAVKSNHTLMRQPDGNWLFLD